jgi:ABC-type antimicrobial peptide transport system permease subunit
MGQSNNIGPSKYVLRVLRFFVKRNYIEEIEGDMEEIFQDNIKTYSKAKARRLYTWETLKLLRPSIMKKIKVNSRPNHYGMFKNHLKTSLRSLRKNTLFSGINITGLAISMAVGTLMILLLSELDSFDDFHVNKDNIYRVTSSKTMFGRERNLATASMFIANELDEKASGVEQVAIVRGGLTADIKTEEGGININGFYTSPSFFDVFSFALKEGNQQSALADPNSIVLTESTSKMLFGKENPMGKPLRMEAGAGQNNPINGIVTGIMENPPLNSHMRFEMLVSLNTLDTASISGLEQDFRTDPQDISLNYIYLVLNDAVQKEQVEGVLANIMNDFNSQAETPITHLLQPLDSFVTSKSSLLENLPGPSFPQSRIFLMIGLTIIVLLSACFNYTNLSLARALRRSKEIGIRKVIGASRFQVFGQFVVEAVILALVALIIGLGLFFLIRPEFLDLPNPAARGHQMFSLDMDYVHLFYFMVFAIVTGCIAGFLPAFILSKLKANVIFNDASKAKIFSGTDLRRILMVFQFIMSISLIMCAVLVHKQYRFAVDYDLGYNTEQIVNITIKGSYIGLLESEYAKIPEVRETSKSSMVLGIGGATMGLAESVDRTSSIRFLVNSVDEKYLDMHEFEILAGTVFPDDLKEGENPEHIIVNEEFLKSLDLGSPKDAIGKNIWYNNNRLRILGVVKNFVNMSLTMNLERAFAFVQPANSQRYTTLGIKLNGTDLIASMEKLEKSYIGIDPVHPFEAAFYDSKIAETYQQHKATYCIISFLAMLAILISTLGLMGMAIFTTESRKKEIGIRKVMGAGIGNLALLLSRSYFVMIIIAGSIAIPFTLYMVNKIVLNEFLYRTKLGIPEVLSGFLIVTVISAITIGRQIIMATVRNPADTLRTE